MNCKKAFLGILIGIGVVPLPLCAQEWQKPAWEYRMEFFGNTGFGTFHNGDHFLGNGLDYGAGIGVRPFSGALKGFGVEGWMSRLTGSESKPNISSSLDSRLLAVSALYHFRSGTRVQPFVSAGMGRIKMEYSYNCTDCVFVPDPVTGELVSVPQHWESKGSKNGIIFGGGMKIAVNRHFSIRPELILADTTAGTGPNWNWVRLQIGMGIHF
jgi:opacity protein-like surface antigen